VSYQIGVASDVADLLTKLNAFLTKGHSLDPAYTGAGTGIIEGLIGTASSVLETITVTFSSSSAFSVSGSVSGSLGSGTVATPFTSSVCNFTIQAGGTAWQAGDTIVFVMTAPWVQLRFSTAINDDYSYCCWRAPGNDGTGSIYVAARRKSNVTGDYDNVRLNGYTSYNAGLGFLGQTGSITANAPCIPLLRVGSMPYWFVANGRRCIIVVKASTRYMAGYLGLIVPYMDNNAHPYPLMIGGSMAFYVEPAETSVEWRWSATSDYISTFPKSNGHNSDKKEDYPCRLRRPDGSWGAYCFYGSFPSPYGGLVHPWASIGTDLRAGLDGSYPVLPLTISENAPNNIWGEMDGMGWVSGHANTVENLVIQNRISWLVVQDVYRTTKIHFFAVKLA
jgi:hypothetical protein